LLIGFKSKCAGRYLILASFVCTGYAPAQMVHLDSLRWIAGTWTGVMGDAQYTEQWMAPAGSSMMGMSRMVADGKTREYEFLRIHQEEDGAIYYTAIPSGQKETSFKLIALNDRAVTFENPAHDFPRRIMYQLRDDGSLIARIEGIQKGKPARVDFPLRREAGR
jgi:hypothetical protein